ncbi:unnamed protein product [Closterium sp. NIES-53]
MASGQQASAEGMAVEGAKDEGEADLAATTSKEAVGVADTAATTRAMDAVAADSTTSATIVTRADIFGAITSSSLMDGPFLKAKRVEEQEEGEEEAVAVAECRSTDSFPGQFFFVTTQAPAAPEKDESFEEPAAVRKVTLHYLDYWVIDSGATYSMTPRADLLTELEPSPVKHVTSALGQRADVKGMGKAMFKGADGKMVGHKNCELEESGAAAKEQHKGEENPKAVAEEYGESMWGTIASAAFSNPTSATGDCDWLTLHQRMGHVALPTLQQLVKNEMVAGIRVKGEPDEVLGCPTCMQAKFTRFPFSSSEATAKAPLDEVVMDVVGPLKLEALAANFGQSEGHVATPFSSGFKCVKGPEEESVGEDERRRFHSLVGSLMYAAVNTQLDVAFATGQLARVVQCHNEEQVAPGMRVAKYLGQTPTVGLVGDLLSLTSSLGFFLP